MGLPPFSSIFQGLCLPHKLIELIHSRMYDIGLKRVCTLGCAGLYGKEDGKKETRKMVEKGETKP